MIRFSPSPRLNGRGLTGTCRRRFRPRLSRADPPLRVSQGDDVKTRAVPPPANFSPYSGINSVEKYKEMYDKSLSDPKVRRAAARIFGSRSSSLPPLGLRTDFGVARGTQGFWSEIIKDLHFETLPDADKDIFSYNYHASAGPVDIKWFPGAKTNVSYNALDRNVARGKGDDTAIIWEGNNPEHFKKVTYSELLGLVCQIANYLKSVGVKKGDRVNIYMPMVPELPATMLACTRIGAIHSVVFAGFSADSLSDRIINSTSEVLITTSAVLRGTKLIPLKQIADDAMALSERGGQPVAHCLVFDNAHALPKADCPMKKGRDVWWEEGVLTQAPTCDPVWMDAEDPLFMLYTSGSTGKPKGVLHTTAGYMVGAYTTVKYIFDVKPGDIYWCTADCGWVTGHTYLTYGPLLNGATTLVFEGVPTFPDAGRCWEIVDKYNVTQFYTAPTALRSLMRFGDDFVKKYKRTSLRILGTVGEPINPEAWLWYFGLVGNSKCPIVDTWWQTETGGIMITPLPGAWDMKPGSATLPFFGIKPVVLDEKGKELEGACEGYLALKQPWPSQMRTVYGDHERFETTYFKHYDGYYFTGDGCRRDADGYYWITGRVDDVINVSGHRIGTAEVESALNFHDLCVESAVVGFEHPVKGQGIYAFVTTMDGAEPNDVLKKELVTLVRSKIGAFAAPDKIHFAPALPKTRSGKIMRRVLRKIASNEEDSLGDLSTLADPSVVQKLVETK